MSDFGRMNHGDNLGAWHEATRVEGGSCLLPALRLFDSHSDRTISCDSQDVSGESEYNEKSSSYMQPVFWDSRPPLALSFDG